MQHGSNRFRRAMRFGLTAAVLAAGVRVAPALYGGAAHAQGELVLTPPAGSHAPAQIVGGPAPGGPSAHTYGLGLLADARANGAASTSSASAPAAATLATLPVSVDLSMYDPPVGDQGQVNSCASWATGYTLLGWYADRYGFGGAPYAPMYVYSQVTGGQNVGTTFEANLSLESQQGIDTQADYTQGTVDYVDQPTAAEKTNAANYKSTGYTSLLGSGGNAQMVIENALAAGYPVAIGIPVYDNFYNATPSTPYVDVPASGATFYGNHAIVAVKYDANGVWIQNQWGTWWGLNGYVELSWAFVNGYVFGVYKHNGFTAPASSAPTPTPYATLPVLNIPTATATATVPTSTPTTVPPTATPSATRTATPTRTPVPPTSTPSSTRTPAPTATRTATATATNTPGPASLRTITLQPASGMPGASFTVQGAGFVVGEAVTVSLAGRTAGTTTASATGSFMLTISVPKNSHAGPVTVTAKGGSGDSTSASFTIL